MEKLNSLLGLSSDNGKILNLTIIYIINLVKETHQSILEWLDDTEINDVIVDALLRATSPDETKAWPIEKVQNQIELIAYISGVIPFFAQRAKRRKVVRELHEIRSWIIPEEANIPIDSIEEGISLGVYIDGNWVH